MSWEVLTMRSVTSFFNPALARSDLRRHWPILFLYTAIWMVALPVQLFRDLAATDVRAAFDGAYVLFCFVVTLVSILGIWALAKLFLPDKRLVGEFVQVCLPAVCASPPPCSAHSA